MAICTFYRPVGRRYHIRGDRREVGMIRTGDEYRAGLRDGREVWIDGERVKDVTIHPAFKPVVDRKARMHDMGHEAAWISTMSYTEDGERFSTLLRPPTEKGHWQETWRAVDA